MRGCRYLCIVVVWTAVCLTHYSNYLTGFREPLSTTDICHTGLKTVYHNHWWSFGLFVIMMYWSLLYTLYDCHDNISTEGFLGRLVCTPRFSWWWFFIVFLLCSLYAPFRDFSCAFCPVTVCLVVLGAPFSSEMSSIFFLVPSSSTYQFFVLIKLMALFVCLQWHTVGAEIKVPYLENPELWHFLPLKPGVGQSIAMHASLTVRKVYILLSDNICLPSPFTVFPQLFHLTFSKKCTQISGQWKIMKSRLQAWSKHYRLIACASRDWLHVHQPFTHSLFGCG